MSQYHYFRAKSLEEPASTFIEESFADENNIQIRRIRVTPTLIKVLTLSFEPTNKVIRELKSFCHYFCRLTLVKEND